MAEIATGNPYDAGSAGSGVGAVILTPNHRDITDIGAAWNKQNADDEEAELEAQKLKQKQAQSLIQDLDVDTKGSLDSDAPYFRQRLSGIIGNQAGLYKQYNGSPTSVDALTAKAHIEADKNILKSEIVQSAGHKEQLLKAVTAMDADKTGENYDKDATNLQIAKFRTANIADRQKLLDANNGSLLVEKPPILSQLAQKRLINPDKYDGGKISRLPNGDYQQQFNRSYSPETLRNIVVDDYKNDPKVIKAANAEYSKLTPDQQNDYKNQAESEQDIEQRTGKPNRVITPQEMLVKGVYETHNKTFKPDIKDYPYRVDPYDLARFKRGLKDDDKGTSDVLQTGANIQNGLLDVVDKAPTDKRTTTTYDPTNPSSISQAVQTANGTTPTTSTLNPDEYGIAKFPYVKNGTADIKIPVTSKNKKGEVEQVVDDFGRPVNKFEKVDNNIRRVIVQGIYDKDGNRTGIKPLVADAQSLVNAGYAPDEPLENWKNDARAFRDFDEGYLKEVARNTGVKDENIENFYKQTHAFNQRVTRTNLASDPNAKRIGVAQPATQTTQPTKTVSESTIKSKVGTKGFEGYSLQELKDYYTSQGYTVK